LFNLSNSYLREFWNIMRREDFPLEVLKYLSLRFASSISLMLHGKLDQKAYDVLWKLPSHPGVYET